MLRSRFGGAVVALTVLSLLPSHSFVAVAAEVPFPDMANTWYGYRESVSYLRDKGAIGGYPEGTFKPAATVNRAEFLKLVFAAKGAPEPVSGDCFLDVKADAWYAPYVCAAARRNIVEGYPSGTGSVFKPGQPVVFAEAIKMALGAYGKEIIETPGGQWYDAYALELDRAGMLPRHSYIPWEPLTRVRAADLIARIVRLEEDRVVLRRSPGCGKPLPAPLTSISVRGIDRTFLLTVPRGYMSQEAAPLILAFHGRTNSNEQVRSYMGLDRAATDYLIAYPSAVKNTNGTFSWTASQDSADLAFVDTLIETLAGSYCIDMNRIFVAGHSLGAWFSNSVACLRGGVVRASGTVGGDSIYTSCAGPSASLMINNPHDALSPFGAAERIRDMRLSENGCQPVSESSQPDALKCRTYSACDGGNIVQWCPHEIDHDNRGVYYPHHWPREAGPTIVKFFEGLK